MRKYKIIKNGYLIGRAKGKSNAINFVKKDINNNDIKSSWHSSNVRIVCLSDRNEYIIEQDKGDL